MLLHSSVFLKSVIHWISFRGGVGEGQLDLERGWGPFPSSQYFSHYRYTEQMISFNISVCSRARFNKTKRYQNWHNRREKTKCSEYSDGWCWVTTLYLVWTFYSPFCVSGIGTANSTVCLTQRLLSMCRGVMTRRSCPEKNLCLLIYAQCTCSPRVNSY